MNTESAVFSGVLRCPECAEVLPGPWQEEEANWKSCPSCQKSVTIWTFPSLRRERQAGRSAIDAAGGEGTCFFHENKQAERACDRCGRFLCAVCDLPIGSRHLCPVCVRNREPGTEIAELVARRTSWPKVAILLGWIPLMPLLWVTWPLYLLTAPAAILVAILTWNQPSSLVHGRRRFSAYLGMAGGLLQMAALVGIFYILKNALHD